MLGCATQPCEKSGYKFAVINPVGTPINAYTVTAAPATPGQSGIRGFCSNQVPVLTYDQTGGTNCTSIMQ